MRDRTLSTKSGKKIELAKAMGFCFGVRRALIEIKKLNKKDKIYVLGKLIHNPQVIAQLKKEGIEMIDNFRDINKGTIVISAHGIPDRLIRKIKEKGLKVVDLTCPFVKTVHDITKKAEKKGKKTIIFGDKEHTEVKGIVGNLKNAVIIKDLSGIRKLDKKLKYCLVSQTTQDVDKFNKLANKLKKKIKDIEIVNTICSPTRERQSDAYKLAKKADIMIVVGGNISANTQRLVKKCSEVVETRHIESAKDLKKSWFKDKRYIGVTAGASTPDWVVEEVLDNIKDF